MKVTRTSPVSQLAVATSGKAVAVEVGHRDRERCRAGRVELRRLERAVAATQQDRELVASGVAADRIISAGVSREDVDEAVAVHVGQRDAGRIACRLDS